MRLRILVLLAGLALAESRLTAAAPAPLPLDTLVARVRRPGVADTLRVQYLMELCGRLQTSDLPAATTYGERGLALARHIGYRRGEAKSLSNLAATYYYAGDYVTAQQAFEQLLTLGQRLPVSWGRSYIGHAYLGLGNVAQALHNVPRALHQFEQARQAYAGAQPPNLHGQILVLSNIGNAYSLTNKYDQAARSLRQALALIKPGTEPRQLVSVLSSLGNIQLEQHQLDSAHVTLTRGLRQALATNNPVGEASIRMLLAQVALGRGQLPEARSQAVRALQLARDVGDLSYEEESLLTLSEILQAQRRPEAYDTLRRYLSVHDTLTAQDRADAIIEAQTRFDLAGQQARLKITAQQRELDRLRYQRQVLGLAGSLLLLLLLGGTALWYVRRRQARREEALRNRLAADLHDDVGTLLSQISLQSGLLQEGLADPAAQRQHLSQITEASRSAVRQLNDVVWSLDAHNDNLQQLADRLRDYAYEVLEPTGAQVQVEVPEHLPALTLPVLLRRNLYLIYKESLHNILKHAATATHIHIRLQLQGSLLQLSIDDNAPSLVLADGEAARPARRSGHGLRNMQARAEAIGGQLTSAPHADGQGFGVQLRVPMQ